MYLSLLYTDLIQRLEENLVGAMEVSVNKGPMYAITGAWFGHIYFHCEMIKQTMYQAATVRLLHKGCWTQSSRCWQHKPRCPWQGQSGRTQAGLGWGWQSPGWQSQARCAEEPGLGSTQRVCSERAEVKSEHRGNHNSARGVMGCPSRTSLSPNRTPGPGRGHLGKVPSETGQGKEGLLVEPRSQHQQKELARMDVLELRPHMQFSEYVFSS